MAEDSPPAAEVEAFLSRLSNAGPEELERASKAVQSGRPAWEAAGKRVAQIVASLGRDEQKAQLCRKAAGIFELKAAQIQPKDRQYALWAAQGVIVGLLAGDDAKATDLHVLKMPLLPLFQETPNRTTGENGYCPKHPTVPLRFGHCRRCDDEERYPRRW